MCEFCEKINDNKNYETPHLMFGNYCKNENDMFYIDIPTDDGLSYSVDNILFCPKCGKKLSERKLEPDNNWMDRLESYCEKYGIQFHGRPLDICLFMELLDKMENKQNEQFKRR